MTAAQQPAGKPAVSNDRRRTLVIVAVIAVAALVLLLVAMCSGGVSKEPAAPSEHAASGQGAASETAAPPAESTATAEPTTPGEDQLYTPAYKPNGREVAVVAVTRGGQSLGTVEFTFYPQDAPNHVANFIELAKKGFYDGVSFHRVEPGFVVQGGDPNTKTGQGAPGTGGPGYRIAAEFNSRKHLDGTVAMARSQDPDSAGSQFYICLGAQSFLDGNYTVFGQVTEGMDVVRQIQVGDVMSSVTIENAD